MEMDCNLKKLASFFYKFFLCIEEKLLKTDYSLFFLGGGIPYYFLLLTAISCSKKGSLSNI